MAFKNSWWQVVASKASQCEKTCQLMLLQREGVGTSKIRTLKGQNIKSIFRMIRMLKDQYVKNQKVEKNVESLKMTFNILIFFDAIGNIRTSKVLVHFLAKNTFDLLILPMASEKIRTSKIKKINYLWQCFSTWVPRNL